MKAPVLSTLIDAVRSKSASYFRVQATRLGYTGKTRDALVAAYEDGMSHMVIQLVQAEIIEVVDVPKKEVG